MATLVPDEHVAGKTLIAGLEGRGYTVQTLKDLKVKDKADPDVIRQVDDRCEGMWVLVTMDLTILEDHPHFDWDRYAIAWIRVHKALRGEKFEASKQNIVHRWVHEIAEQARGDHFTYYEKRHVKSPPSLGMQLKPL